MDFYEMYYNPSLLASNWHLMGFLARLEFYAFAKKMRELEEIARELLAERQLRERLAEELDEKDADDLLKVLKGDFSACSDFWQDDPEEASEKDEEEASAKKSGKYKHLSLMERIVMVTLRSEGNSISDIGRKMNRNKGTVSRELRRFDDACSLISKYDPEKAHENYLKKRKKCGRKSVLTQEIIKKVYELMKGRRMSPEQIANTELKGVASKATIYRGFDREVFPSDAKRYLWRKGKKNRRLSLRRKYRTGKSIHERPAVIDLRTEFGHWEADTIESCRSGTGCVFVLHERKTRFTITCRSLFFDADSMKKFIIRTIRKFPKGVFKSITCDRGKEFAEFLDIEDKTGVNIYFADPHCPNQKGSVEHANGLIRRFFPKGTDFGKINSTILYHQAVSYINAWPMEVLCWKTPRQAFQGELASL